VTKQYNSLEIEDEIVLELSRNLYAVPWAKRIEKTKVAGR
jgi:hypothetical protein